MERFLEMKAARVEFELRERVKELRCLYELSRIAWERERDLPYVLNKTLRILPSAMQFPLSAQARIVVDKYEVATGKFNDSHARISSPLITDNTKRGVVEIGYITKTKKLQFLREEKSMLKTVARELSLIIQRFAMEEEKQKLQLQLQHVERLAFVGELTAGIAHELNEPLGRILGFAQLIKKGGALNEQQEEDIERIVKASLYTREIIKKLMIFSRQMPQQLTSVNLNDTISNILYFIDVRYQSGNIVLRKKLDPDLPTIEADAVQLSQVLVNLITNAIHAMSGGGELVLSTQRKDKLVSLIVRDSGTGMSAAVKKKIFEPFFTTKPVGQGTGLGLSVVQGIVAAHQGKIQVTSSPGKGSRFEILLPINQSKRKSK